MSFADVESEALVALPESAGERRRFWLADDQRNAPATIAALARNVDEILEAVATGPGVVLLSEGNAVLCRRDIMALVRVVDLPFSELAVITRAGRVSSLVERLVEALAAGG